MLFATNGQGGLFKWMDMYGAKGPALIVSWWLVSRSPPRRSYARWWNGFHDGRATGSWCLVKTSDPRPPKRAKAEADMTRSTFCMHTPLGDQSDPDVDGAFREPSFRERNTG